MLAAGKKIARDKGCSALRIREIVDSAGVNLGMFHYHFKNRKRFTRLVLTEVYGEFFGKFYEAATTGTDSLTQLRAAVIVAGQFLRDERRLVFALLRDMLSGELEVIRYSSNNVPPHLGVLGGLVGKCQKEGLLPKLPLSQILPLFFGAIAQPLLFNELLEKARKSVSWFDPESVLSDEAIAERVDIVLRGLRAKSK
jgi:AcrR family transcriptional regulator